MNTVEIIRRVCDATPEQLSAIEKILAGETMGQTTLPPAVSGYRIKGKNGFTFELSRDLSSLTAYRAGKRSPSHDQALRALTRGYLNVLIAAQGQFVRRSEIERIISLEAGDASGKQYLGRTEIRDVFRYMTPQDGKRRQVRIPLFHAITRVQAWDPEYALPAERVETLFRVQSTTYPELSCVSPS